MQRQLPATKRDETVPENLERERFEIPLQRFQYAFARFHPFLYIFLSVRLQKFIDSSTLKKKTND